MMTKHKRLLVVALTCLLLGCFIGIMKDMVFSQSSSAASSASKVLVIVEENHSYAQAKAGMPQLMAYANQYGYATNWKATRHPSLPNYLAIFGGSTFGVTNDKPPATNSVSGQSVFDQTVASGKTAKTYAETMPANCRLTGSGNYVVRHNPWTYFVDGRASCNSFDVPLGSLGSEIQSGLPTVGLVVPNLVHDAHDGSLAVADTWLKGWLNQIIAGPDFQAGRLTVVVTFDEDNKASGNNVLTVVLNPSLNHVVATSALTHYSLTRYMDQVAGVPLLRNAATAPDLSAAFGL